MTAAEVAEELEVSLATARRDLEALSAAGIPVYVQQGRGGGWQLVGGARTDLSGLTGHESRALFWLLGTAGLSGPETRTATLKLIYALPHTLRAEAERLATSIHYDHEAWGDRRRQSADPFAPLRDAVVHRRVVRASYTSRDGAGAHLTMKPLGLVAKAGVWYLAADAGDGPRVFRVERITEVEDAGDRFEPPRGFDLAEFWREQAEQIERRRSAVAATLRVDRRFVAILQQQFGRNCEIRALDDGHALVEVRAHLLVGLAEQLAGWGGRIEVVSPRELRAELHRIGAELVARFADAGGGTLPPVTSPDVNREPARER